MPIQSVGSQPRPVTIPQPAAQPPQSRPAAAQPVDAFDGPAPAAAPPRYFAFASPSDDKPAHANGLSVGEVKSIIVRYGKNVMIGFDRGSFSDADLQAMQQGRTGDIQNPALRYAVEHGARLHAYVEGPGGETGASWSADEKQRVRDAAKSVGITVRDPSNPNDPGTQAWEDHGWKDYAHQQLAGLKKAGFESVEIDNLDSAKHVGTDPAGTVSFFQEYAGWFKSGEVPRLLPKNLDEGQWKAVVDAVKSGRLPRAMFSDFAIAEQGVGSNRDTQARLAAQIGIQLLKSNDTNNYDASGAYGL